MKNIINIARLELSTLFFSPIAWLILIIFSFQSGLQVTEVMERLDTLQQLSREISDLTYRLFCDPYSGGLFPAVQSKLYLYIPLLTMGLMSKETSSGTVKLLLSSPVKIREIVLGKFLAMMVYGLLLMAVLSMFLFMGIVTVEAFDLKLVLSGMLGLYLLLCAYSAIGLFMSSLTSYQVVAAISTLMVLAILSYIGTVGQGVDMVRDITYFLSIAGRSNKFIEGLISSKDVIYFVIVTIMFLGFCIFKLQADRKSQGFAIKAGRYVLLITLVIITGYISSRPALTGYYDMTARKNQTLTKGSQEVVKKITKPVKITTYVNLLDEYYYYGMPIQKLQDERRFEQFTRFLPELKMEYVYYYDKSDNSDLYKANKGLSEKELAQRVATSARVDFDLFLSPPQIKKIINLEHEHNRFVRLVEIDGKKTFLRVYDDMMRLPSETEISAALKRLILTPPKVGFLTGELERSIDRAGDKDYRTATNEQQFRYSLVNQGFDVIQLSLEDQNIPEDLSVLVIADPKKELGQVTTAKILKFISSGGNVMIAGEPGKQQILKPVLDTLGVHFMDGMLVQKSKDFAPDLLMADLSPDASKVSGAFNEMEERGRKIILPGSVGLSYGKANGFNVIPLLVTNKKEAWNKMGKLEADSAAVSFKPEDGDDSTSVPAVIGLTRKIAGKEQRIIVSGDADFMSSGELTRSNPRTNNFAFTVQLFKWFSNGEFPVDTHRPKPKDNSVKIKRAGVVNLKILFLGILPGFLIIASMILLVRRKRR